MKILISDFDNTFFTDDYLENIKLVHEFVDEGNIFVIATGRPIFLLKKDIDKYNIPYSYLICNDGAVIFDKDENILFMDNIDKDVTNEIYNELASHKIFNEVHIDTATEFTSSIEGICNGIVALPYENKREECIELLKKICTNYDVIHGYMSHRWLNILSVNSSKATGIEKLLEIANLKDHQIIVVGDNENDLSMINHFDGYLVKGLTELEKDVPHVVNDFKNLIEIIKEDS